MQYLCKAISIISVLLCTVQSRRCFKNKLQCQIKSVLMFRLIYFATYHLVDLHPIPPPKNHLFYSEGYKMLSVSCAPCWHFCVHLLRCIGSRKEKKHKNCRNSQLPMSRGEENAASTEQDSLCGWDQQRGREMESEEEELRFHPKDEGIIRCQRSSGIRRLDSMGEDVRVSRQQEMTNYVNNRRETRCDLRHQEWGKVQRRLFKTQDGAQQCTGHEDKGRESPEKPGLKAAERPKTMSIKYSPFNLLRKKTIE